MNISIAAGRPLLGDHRVPGDKSISHRALIIASLAEGTSSIRGLSTAADPASTRRCVEALGVSIRLQGSEVIVDGPGRRGLCPPTTGLDAGNSGTTMRLLAGILAGQAFAATITGDESLLRRPMRRVTEPLRLMGAAVSSTDGGTGPLRFLPTPGLHGITYRPPMASAQVKSCVLLAGLYASGETVVEEPEVAHGQDQGPEISQGIGFDQKAVSARVVGPGNVIGPVGGAEDQHRQSPELRLLPDPPQNLEAGPVG